MVDILQELDDSNCISWWVIRSWATVGIKEAVSLMTSTNVHRNAIKQLHINRCTNLYKVITLHTCKEIYKIASLFEIHPRIIAYIWCIITRRITNLPRKKTLLSTHQTTSINATEIYTYSHQFTCSMPNNIR